MRAFLPLVLGVVASLFVGLTTATPINTERDVAINGTTDSVAHTLGYTRSVQIILARHVMVDYEWTLYQGPYGIPVNPCKPGAFKLAYSLGDFDYHRDDINSPPNPPAMELEMSSEGWMHGHKCVWKTNGGGDVGKIVCSDGWGTFGCERDRQWTDGAINCHGWSAHRAYNCNH